MRIGCMQSTLWPILMTMLIWNDLMNSQHDNLSRGSPRLMTSDRQILYPHQARRQRSEMRVKWAERTTMSAGSRYILARQPHTGACLGPSGARERLIAGRALPVSRWLFCHGRTACPPGRARALRTVDAGRRHAMPRMRIDPSIGPGRSRTPRWKALDELFNLRQSVLGTVNSMTI